MHEIRTVKCPKCGTEVQVFDTDHRAACPKCGTSFEVPSKLEEKLARQAKEAMEYSVAEMQNCQAKPDAMSRHSSLQFRKIMRILIYVIVLLGAFLLLLMLNFSHTVT